MSEKMLTRAFECELRAERDEKDSRPKIVGHPVLYNKPTDIGGWYEEEIERGALDGCDLDDVFMFVNHDTRMIPVARARRNNGSSTMQVSIENDGLHTVAFPDVDNNVDSRALYSSVERGDLDGMSFRMWIAEERWTRLNTDYPKRTILKIKKIDEVSAVNFPAYKSTSIACRSLDNDNGVLDNMPAELRAALDNAKKEPKKNDEIEILKLKMHI